MLALEAYALALSNGSEMQEFVENTRKMFSDILLAARSLLFLCVLESFMSYQAAGKNKLHSVHALYLACESELQEWFKVCFPFWNPTPQCPHVSEAFGLEW